MAKSQQFRSVQNGAQMNNGMQTNWDIEIVMLSVTDFFKSFKVESFFRFRIFSRF